MSRGILSTQRLGRAFCVAAAAFAVAGCQQFGAPGPEPEISVVGNVQNVEPVKRESRPITLGAIPSTPAPAPDELFGMRRAEVVALLGEPGYVRREAPAEVWQYQANDCVLDLFLYGANGGAYRVAYLEARQRTLLGDDLAPETCLSSVHAQRQAPAG